MKKSLILCLLLVGCIHLPKTPTAPPPVVEHVAFDFTTYQIAMTVLPEALQILKDCDKWPEDRSERVRITREYTDQIVAMLNTGVSEADILQVFSAVCSQ